MARGISDYGNGLGYLYVVDQAGTGILATVPNSLPGARTLREIADRNGPLAGGRAAVGTLTITGCASVGAVTSISIGGVNQLAAAVNCATNTPSVLAAQLVAAINAYAPPAPGDWDYTASNIGAVITIMAPTAAGSSVNGLPIVVAVTSGTITFVVTDLVNGSDIGGTFDQSLGVRFYMDADYGPSGIPGSVPATQTSITYAIEITKYITLRGMEGGNDVQTIVLSSGAALGISRKSATTMVMLDTEGAAASDNLIFIDTTDFIEGDLLVLRGVDSSRVVTVVSSTGINENISTSLAASFALDSQTAVLIVYFSNDPTDGAFFYEATRTNSQVSIPTQANIRAAGVPMGVQGVTTTTLTAGGGSLLITAGVSKQTQYYTGSATLAASWSITFATSGAMDGDEIEAYYYATLVLAGNTVTIGGYSLTDDQALGGGLMVYGKFDATNNVWRTQLIAAPVISQYGMFETIVVPVSFETGFLGSNKIRMGFKGNVVAIDAAVVFLIEATDNATITPNINAVNITGGLVTLTGGTGNGGTFSNAAPMTVNSFLAGDYIDLLGAKVTAGGSALVTLKVERKR